MNAYLLALAAVLLAVARARIDRRLLAVAGGLAAAIGSIVCATADSTSTLVIGRAVDGAGLALLLVSLATPLAAPRRVAAVAAFPLAAFALGPLVGGELAEHNWWHLYFWAGVPVAAILAAPALLDGGRTEPDRAAPGGPTLAFAAGLVALTILVVQMEPWGVDSRELVDLLAVGAALMVGTGLLASDRAIWAGVAGALAALCFLLPQYFELAHLIHPLRSGIRLSALTIAAAAGGALAWQLRSLVPAHLLAIVGAAAAAVGAVSLGQLDPQSGSALLGVGLVLTGGGFGVAAGAAAGGELGDLLRWAAVGASLGVALVGAVFQNVQASERASGATFEDALSRGVATGALILVPLAAAVGVAAWRARPASSAARPAAES
jgi:MFS family permease